MLGLKASSLEMRRKFFQIYNRTIPTPLFDRLQFLICTQNWEKLAGTFWLKEALVSLPLQNLQICNPNEPSSYWGHIVVPPPPPQLSMSP